MKKKKLQCSVPTLLLAGVLCLTLAACGAKQSSDMPASDTVLRGKRRPAGKGHECQACR